MLATQPPHSDGLVGFKLPEAQNLPSTALQLVHWPQSAFDMFGSRRLHSVEHLTALKLQNSSAICRVQIDAFGRYTGT